jgi:hypothetical protein
VICRRHNAIATHSENGIPYCLGCFREALEAAERVELGMTVAELMRRLKWRV